MLAINKININKNHCSKTLHLLVEITTNILEGLINTSACMSMMFAIVVL